MVADHSRFNTSAQLPRPDAAAAKARRGQGLRLRPILALYSALFPGGYVTDPQTGTSNQLNSFTTRNHGQPGVHRGTAAELVVQGPAEFLRRLFYSQNTNNQSNYYVESSSLTAYAQLNNALAQATVIPVDPSTTPTGYGHNYYDSRNHSVGQSTAGFGEVYWNITPDLKLTWWPLYGRPLDDDLYPIEPGNS